MVAGLFDFMAQFIPPARPKRDTATLDAVKRHFALPDNEASLIFVRGYYLNSIGKHGANDINVYDDAVFLVSPNITESWNANTDPSFANKNLAKLDLGYYQYYRGLHRNRIKALRPYPEGRLMPVTRDGKRSTATHTNIHDGGMTNSARDGRTWSLGCLTIPKTQYKDFQTRVYTEMDRCRQSTINVVLVENRQTAHGQQLFDQHGKII